MPELPEVQTTVNGINDVAKGATIIDVWTDYESPYFAQKQEIKNPKYFSEFKKKIIGAHIIHATRRAKNILIHLSNNYVILIHMKMTGHVMYGHYQFKKDSVTAKTSWHPVDQGPLRDPFNRFIHLVFTIEHNKKRRHLVLSDMRKFAKVTLLKKEELENSPHLDEIGPEPLSDKFTFTVLQKRLLLRPHGNIKTVLMMPTIIAGIGNIYSDEILWHAGIHPEEKVKKVCQDTSKKSRLYTMFKAIKTTLRKGIDFGGDSMSDYRNIHGERGAFQEKHNAYRKTGSACARRGCKGSIVRKVVGGRSAHFCDVHQKKM